jgi:hypothetical protein
MLSVPKVPVPEIHIEDPSEGIAIISRESPGIEVRVPEQPLT